MSNFLCEEVEWFFSWKWKLNDFLWKELIVEWTSKLLTLHLFSYHGYMLFQNVENCLFYFAFVICSLHKVSSRIVLYCCILIWMTLKLYYCVPCGCLVFDKMPERRCRAWDVAPLALMWIIWWERNRWAFEFKERPYTLEE